jgi:2-methylcitrate dehydratase PrpD
MHENLARNGASEAGVTERLGSQIAGTTLADLPVPVRATIADHLLDALGVGVAATREDPGRIITDLFHDGAHGPNAGARLFGSGKRVEPWDAAWANGTFCHLLDFDDIEHHPTACILPAALAVGETVDAGGADLLVAMAVGYEVFLRLSQAETTNSHLLRFSKIGIHPMAVLGPPAAAAAAAKMLGLDGERTAVAIGIAASSSFGLLEQFGTWVKGVHAGNAARAGTMAALLSSRGYFGSTTAIEGRYGLLNATIREGHYDFKEFDRPWGARWAIHEPGVPLKPFPVCGGNQRASTAAIHLRRLLKGPEEIDRIEISVTEAQRESVHVDWPQRGFGGKFSHRYAVAAALLDGRVDIDSFSDESFARPEMQDMLGRVHINVIKGGYENNGSEFRRRTNVKVTRRDGSTIDRTEDWPLGSLRNPMPHAGVLEKYTATSCRVLDQAQVDRTIALFEALESTTVREMVSSVITTSGAAR